MEYKCIRPWRWHATTLQNIFFALIPLLGSKVNKKFQDRLEQVGGQMLLYQFVGAKTEVLTIPIYKCTKLCLVLLGHEILETLISITLVMEKLRLTFPWDPGGHSSSYLHIESYKSVSLRAS